MIHSLKCKINIKKLKNHLYDNYYSIDTKYFYVAVRMIFKNIKIKQFPIGGLYYNIITNTLYYSFIKDNNYGSI